MPPDDNALWPMNFAFKIQMREPGHFFKKGNESLRKNKNPLSQWLKGFLTI